MNTPRCLATKACCVFPTCFESKILRFPIKIRSMLFPNYKFYVPQKAAICNYHLSTGNWSELVESPQQSYLYSRKMIEDMLSLATENQSEANITNNIFGNDFLKIIGLSTTQLNSILENVPSLHESISRKHDSHNSWSQQSFTNFHTKSYDIDGSKIVLWR